MTRRAWTRQLTRARPQAARVRRCAHPAVPSVQDFPVTPVPKPRQTRRDRWAKRPCVLRYRAFCDELRLRQAQLPERYAVVFVMPMPASWSHRRRAQMIGRPHQSKPDLSNLEKSVEDALVPDDERLFSNRGLKIWGESGRVIILDRGADAEESDTTLIARALAHADPVTGDQT
ncbi:MAG: RusA family crossover junction endodeoxyribonuclease [Rudaea sp.]